MRRHMLRRGIATAMIAIMLLLSMDAGCISALAAEPSIPRVETTETEERATGYVDLGLRAPSIKGSNSHGMNLNYATNLPEEYDSRTKGYVTPIRNQNPWGTCWAFAACAAMESYALAHGLVEHPEDIDLSEYALTFLTFSDNMYYDMTGDETLCLDTEYYGFNQGGNDGYVFKTLSKWAGIYTEDGSYEAAKENGITPYVPKEENRDYILTGQYYLSMEDQDLVKQAIMDHGAVTASYFSDMKYETPDGTYVYTYDDNTGTNHAIAIVGWDDNKDRTLFYNNGHMPKSNGAWLIKNSWGPSYGENGYIWISYEDKILSTSDAVVYEIASRDTYDNVYQHDGANLFYSYIDTRKCASVYQIQGADQQYIEAVSFALRSVNNSYTVSIYKNANGASLEQGELVATKRGRTTYSGYYTVVLDQPILTNEGETYSVILSFDQDASIAISRVEYDIRSAIIHSTGKPGESYCYWSNKAYDFLELYGDSVADICIKLMTSNVDQEVRVPNITDVRLTDRNMATVTWQQFAGAQSYDLWMGESSTDANPKVVTVTDSWASVQVELGKEYYFKVRANYGEEGTSEYSNWTGYKASLPTLSLTAKQEDWTVTLSWERISFVDGYRSYRGTEGEEPTLCAEITDGDIVTYQDMSSAVGHTYTYYICAYIGEIESDASNSVRCDIPVPEIGLFSCRNLFYGRLELTWYPAGDVVDGYELEVISQGHREVVTIQGAMTDSYTYSTLGLSLDAEVELSICAYVLQEDGSKIYSRPLRTYCDRLKGPALDLDVKWYLDSGRVFLQITTREDVSEIRIYESLEDYNYTSYTLSNGTATIPWLYLSEVQGLYITDDTSAFQEEPYKVGMAFVEPNIEPIYDIVMEEGQESVTLTANITNPMENFLYEYQWYVLDHKNGEAVPIQGANTNTYQASVGATETKYYFCEISIRYDFLQTRTTVNEKNEPTRVRGYLAKPEMAFTEQIHDQIYTGQEIRPVIDVTADDVALRPGMDYVLTYSNNINVGTATIDITFIGQYEGIEGKRFTFRILPYTYNEQEFLCEPIGAMTYTGTLIQPSLEIYDTRIPTPQGGYRRLEEGRDYTLVCRDNLVCGRGSVTVIFQGNYVGSLELEFDIVAKDMSYVQQPKIEAQSYTGWEIRPEVFLYNGDLTLVQGVDYWLFYENNIHVGENSARVVVNYMGNYTGTAELYFTILAPEERDITVHPIEDQIYDPYINAPDVTISYKGVALTNGLDYSIVEYGNNQNVTEEAYVLIEYLGDFAELGYEKIYFKINPKSATNFDVIVSGSFQYALGNAIKPMVTIWDEFHVLRPEVDYSVTYVNNISAGTGTIVITYKGNYMGTSYQTFEILPLSVNNGDATIVVDRIEPQGYTGAAICPSLNVRNTDIPGQDATLIEGVDYRVEYLSGSNVAPGIAQGRIIFQGNYEGERTFAFEIIRTVPETITSPTLSVNQQTGYISKLTVGTTVTSFIQWINEKDHISVYKDKTQVSGNTAIGTGMLVHIVDGDRIVKTYTILVTGDTNGDGKINITDMIAVKASVLKKSQLTGAYAKACDVNGDGKVNITDFIKIKAVTLRKDTITGVTAQ